MDKKEEKISDLEEEIDEEEEDLEVEEDLSKTHTDKKRFVEEGIGKNKKKSEQPIKIISNLETTLSNIPIKKEEETRRSPTNYQSYSETKQEKYEIEDEIEKQRRKVMGAGRVETINIGEQFYEKNTPNPFFSEIEHKRRSSLSDEFPGMNNNLSQNFDKNYESKDGKLRRKDSPFSDYDPFGVNQ